MTNQTGKNTVSLMALMATYFGAWIGLGAIISWLVVLTAIKHGYEVTVGSEYWLEMAFFSLAAICCVIGILSSDPKHWDSKED